jgi:hypothetical protein
MRGATSKDLVTIDPDQDLYTASSASSPRQTSSARATTPAPGEVVQQISE